MAMHLRSYVYGLATAALLSGALAFAQAGRPASDPVMATVNGTPITYQQLIARLLQSSGQSALDAMVNRAVIDQAAQQQGVTVTPADLQARLDQIQKMLGGAEVYRKFLAANGLTDAQQREQLRYVLLNEKLALKATPISDRDLERLQVRIIATNDVERAKTVIRLLRQRQDMAVLAPQYSEHPNGKAAEPGLLDPFTRFQMPQLWSYASKLQPGEFTPEPVKAADGYLMVKLEKRFPGSTLKPAERAQLISLITAERAARWLDNARKAAQVSYPTPLKSLLGTSAARDDDARAAAGR